MILFFLTTVCVVLVLLLIWKIHKTATYWKNAGIPYEPYSSYLYCYLFVEGKVDVYQLTVEHTKKYGPVYGTYMGLNPVLRVSSREGIRDALQRNFSKAHGRTISATTGSPLWDNNILALEYQKWKMVRALSSHVLTGSKLRYMKGTLERVANRLTSKLKVLAKNNAEISTAQYAQGAIMDGISAVTFGLEVDALEDPNNIFIKNCTGIFSNSLGLTILFTFPKLLKYLPGIQFPKKENETFFVDFSKTILKQRRAQVRKPEEFDVLDIWLETQKTNPELTDEILISQMFVFFIAGYETSAYNLMTILYLLAMHPKKQQALYENIMENITDPDNITFEDYGKMKYLEAALYETLRLYPSDYVIDRITTEPCVVADVRLDEGINIQVPVTSVHRDPELFHDPTHFKPERFIDGGENTNDVMSFGDGPKNCVGQRFAIFQLHVFVVAILRSVRLEPADDSYDPSREYQDEFERLPGQLFLPFPKKPLKVRLAPRN